MQALTCKDGTEMPRSVDTSLLKPTSAVQAVGTGSLSPTAHSSLAQRLSFCPLLDHSVSLELPSRPVRETGRSLDETLDQNAKPANDVFHPQLTWKRSNEGTDT
jgi:hypothetical protein